MFVSASLIGEVFREHATIPPQGDPLTRCFCEILRVCPEKVRLFRAAAVSLFGTCGCRSARAEGEAFQEQREARISCLKAAARLLDDGVPIDR